MAVPKVKVPGSSLRPGPVGSSLNPDPRGSSLRPVAAGEMRRPLGAPMKPRSSDPENGVGRIRPGAPGDEGTYHPISRSTMPVGNRPVGNPQVAALSNALRKRGATKPPGNLEKFPRVIPDKPGAKPPVFRTQPAPAPALPNPSPLKQREMEHAKRVKANIKRHQPLRGHALEDRRKFGNDAAGEAAYRQHRDQARLKKHAQDVKEHPERFDKNGRPRKDLVTISPMERFNKGSGKKTSPPGPFKSGKAANKAAAIKRLLNKEKSK